MTMTEACRACTVQAVLLHQMSLHIMLMYAECAAECSVATAMLCMSAAIQSEQYMQPVHFNAPSTMKQLWQQDLIASLLICGQHNQCYCMQSPGEQHAAWFRELQIENALRSVHDNLYKMEEYAMYASGEAYAGGMGRFHLPCTGLARQLALYCMRPSPPVHTLPVISNA